MRLRNDRAWDSVPWPLWAVQQRAELNRVPPQLARPFGVTPGLGGKPGRVSRSVVVRSATPIRVAKNIRVNTVHALTRPSHAISRSPTQLHSQQGPLLLDLRRLGTGSKVPTTVSSTILVDMLTCNANNVSTFLVVELIIGCYCLPKQILHLQMIPL